MYDISFVDFQFQLQQLLVKEKTLQLENTP